MSFNEGALNIYIMLTGQGLVPMRVLKMVTTHLLVIGGNCIMLNIKGISCNRMRNHWQRS